MHCLRDFQLQCWANMMRDKKAELGKHQRMISQDLEMCVKECPIFHAVTGFRVSKSLKNNFCTKMLPVQRRRQRE